MSCHYSLVQTIDIRTKIVYFKIRWSNLQIDENKKIKNAIKYKCLIHGPT